MKKVNNLSKVLCALGVSTVLIAGVACAASTYPAPSSWNGIGSVASPLTTLVLLLHCTATIQMQW